MSIRTSNGQALTALILEVFRMNGEMLRAGNELTKPFNLTSARWQIMGAIDEGGRSLTVSQIARRMGLARQGVQRIVNDLEAMGLLERTPNVDHKSAPLCSLSPKGEEIIAHVNVEQAKWVNELSDGLSAEQLNRCREMLQAIREQSEN